MADLSKLNFDGTDYNIKDVTARNKQASQVSVSMNANGGSIAIKYADGSTGTGVSIPIATAVAAGLLSAADKAKLDTLISSSTHALNFIGFTTTALTDGATTSTLVADSSKWLSKTTGFVAGDVVFYGHKEFIWNGSSWTEFGDGSSLRALAFKDSASGTMTIPATGHTHSTPSLSHSVTQGDVSASGSYTPEGTVSVTTNDTIPAVPESDGTQDLFVVSNNVEDVTLKPVGGTTSVQSMTGVGTLPTSEVKNIPNVTSVGVMFKVEITGETLKLIPGTAPTLGTAISVNSMKSAGTLPTRQAVTVATAGNDVTVSKYTKPSLSTTIGLEEGINVAFAGTAKTVSVTGKTTGVAVANHAAGNTGAPSGTETKTVTVS